MVNHQHQGLDHVFAALADPTRRAILARLEQESMSITTIAAPFSIKLPGSGSSAMERPSLRPRKM